MVSWMVVSRFERSSVRLACSSSTSRTSAVWWVPVELGGDVFLELHEQDGLADDAIADDEVHVGSSAGSVAPVGEQSVHDLVAPGNGGWIDPEPCAERIDIRRHTDVTHHPNPAMSREHTGTYRTRCDVGGSYRRSARSRANRSGFMGRRRCSRSLDLALRSAIRCVRCREVRSTFERCQTLGRSSSSSRT